MEVVLGTLITMGLKRNGKEGLEMTFKAGKDNRG